MLRELIPGDLLKVQSSIDWKRTITAAYNQDTGSKTISVLNKVIPFLFMLTFCIYAFQV